MELREEISEIIPVSGLKKPFGRAANPQPSQIFETAPTGQYTSAFGEFFRALFSHLDAQIRAAQC